MNVTPKVSSSVHLFDDPEETDDDDPMNTPNSYSEIENIEGLDYDIRVVNTFETLGVIGIVFILLLTNIVLIGMGKIEFLPYPDPMFALYISLFFGIFIGVSIAGGSLVVYCNVDVMFTRKFIHFFSFFLPFGLFQLVPFEKTLTTYLLTFCAAFVSYIPLISGIRSLKYMLPLRLAFASFDRKQDRPLTLLWAVSQSISAYIALLPTALILENVFHSGKYVMIPLFIVAIGDGLAEIIGRKLGRHKYRTRAMCTSKVYTRSVEGSMCVFLTGVITIMIIHFTMKRWNWIQTMVAECIIPISMTIAEAYSPHSWDNAFLLAVGGAMTIGVFCLELIFDY